jgi:hypothetical protein
MSIHSKIAGASESTTITGDDGTANNKRISIYEFALDTGETEFTFTEAVSNDNGQVTDATSLSTGTTSSISVPTLFMFSVLATKNNTIGAEPTVSWSNSFVPIQNGDWVTNEMSHSAGFVNLDATAGTKETTGTISGGSIDNNGLAAALLVFQTSGGSRSILNINGTNSVVPGTTATINGVDFQLPVSSVTLGGETVTVTGTPTTTAIDVIIGADIDLRWGTTNNELIVNDAGGQLTFQNVTVLDRGGWERVELTSLPDEVATESFYEYIKTDATVGNLTMAIGDYLMWESYTGLTIDNKTIPTVSPAANATGEYKVWDVSEDSYTATSTYSITQGEEPATVSGSIGAIGTYAIATQSIAGNEQSNEPLELNASAPTLILNGTNATINTGASLDLNASAPTLNLIGTTAQLTAPEPLFLNASAPTLNLIGLTGTIEVTIGETLGLSVRGKIDTKGQNTKGNIEPVETVIGRIKE